AAIRIKRTKRKPLPLVREISRQRHCEFPMLLPRLLKSTYASEGKDTEESIMSLPRRPETMKARFSGQRLPAGGRGSRNGLMPSEPKAAGCGYGQPGSSGAHLIREKQN